MSHGMIISIIWGNPASVHNTSPGDCPIQPNPLFSRRTDTFGSSIVYLLSWKDKLTNELTAVCQYCIAGHGGQNRTCQHSHCNLYLFYNLANWLIHYSFVNLSGSAYISQTQTFFSKDQNHKSQHTASYKIAL